MRPTTSDAFPLPAPRPAYSVLGHETLLAAGVAPIADWRAGLAAHFDHLGSATTRGS